MRNADFYSSLSAGSKNRLKQFRSNLMRDYDRRNFDKDACKLIQQYLTSLWKDEFKKTEKYLRNLRSSKDGKLYSQGVKEYAKLLKAGHRFAEPNHAFFGWNQHYKRAKEELMAEFSQLSLHPLMYHCDDDIIKALPRLDTHAGFEFIISGKKEKGDNLEDVFSKYLVSRDSAIEIGTFGKPILPAVRTQGKGNAFHEDGSRTNDCDHKTRLVSMVDMFVIISELRFAKPIQDYLAQCKWYAGGKDLDYGVANIISGLRSKFGYWISLDYEAFDQSISAWLIRDVFEIMRCGFKTLSELDSAEFSIVEDDFIEKDFIFGREIIHSKKGVPSGSMFTQIVDSLVNVLVVRTYLYSQSIKGDMIVMGDDNLVYMQEFIDPANLSSYLSKNFGMEVNAIKTKTGRHYEAPTFLSCRWFPEGRFREHHEVIGKILYPERKREYGRDAGSPQEVIWSYILTYRITMYQMMDVAKFLNDFPYLKKTNLKTLGSHKLPGLLRYLVNYTGGYWSKAA